MQCAYGVLGITSQLRVDRMLEALRLDAAWLKTFATPAQSALLAGRDVRQPPATMWADSDDAQRQLRDERHAILRAREGEPT